MPKAQMSSSGLLKDSAVECCREGESDSQEGWLNRLRCTTGHFLSLLDQGVFRRIPSAQGKIRKYSIQLVGLVFLEEGCLISLPKISNNSFNQRADLLKELDLTVRVIDRYRKDSRRKTLLPVSTNDLVVSGDGAHLVDLFVELVKFTDDFGFHTEEQHRRVASNGVIDWPSTIRSRLALHGDGFTVYDQPILRKRISVEGRLKRYQAHAIHFLASALGPIAPIVAGSHWHVVLEATDIVRGWGASEFSPRQSIDEINDFLDSANRDHDQDLGKLILRVLEKNLPRGRRIPKVYGATSFGYVWQAICSALLVHGSTALVFKDKANHIKQQTGSVNVDWLIPDHFVELISTNELFLFDSKWHLHTVDFSSDDLVKQFFYELSLRVGKSLSGNNLLVPTNDQVPVLHGKLTPISNNLVDARFNGIGVIGVPWNAACHAYLGGYKESLFNAIFQLARRQ